jgi:hypothetical protein
MVIVAIFWLISHVIAYYGDLAMYVELTSLNASKTLTLGALEVVILVACT